MNKYINISYLLIITIISSMYLKLTTSKSYMDSKHNDDDVFLVIAVE